MEISFSDKSLQLQRSAREFMERSVLPAEPVYERQLAEMGNRGQPAIMEELKREAKERGLWNLFLCHGPHSAGLTNFDYAPIVEIAARSPIGLEAMNCSAPDTGNMELLDIYGTDEQKKRWLEPLLDGRIRSCFAMTEPEIASSDPTDLSASISRDGDELVVNGRKWFASGIYEENCEVILFVGRSNEEAERHKRHSVVIIPRDTPGVRLVRDIPMFGFHDKHGHGEVLFEDVRVPATSYLGEEGTGFQVAQARLGPGRIHYGMRAIAMGERALELMCRRALARSPFGKPLAEQSLVEDWIARSRIAIDQARLLVLRAAHMIDTQGTKAARREIAEVKVAALDAAWQTLDRAVQVHGAAGVSDDTPLARMWALARALRIADGPDQVHLRSLARAEIRQYR